MCVLWNLYNTHLVISLIILKKIQFNLVLFPTQCEIFQLSCLVLCLYGIPEVHALSDGLLYSLTISCN